MSEAWWETFFDSDYFAVWGAWLSPERTAREADDAWRLLALAPGMRVLDAPCGFGRLSRALAERGARVTGVDQSAEMIAQAERDRGSLEEERLRYRRHDLRVPLGESGYDAALDVFSSIGYGSEEDDLAVLRTLASALRPGGRLVLETAHRDMVVTRLSQGAPPGARAPDGTLVVEEPRFDALAGRVETTWHFCGPRGAGSKRASLRIYSITELAGLLERAGLRVRSLHAGLSPEPLQKLAAPGALMLGRVGLVAERARD